MDIANASLPKVFIPGELNLPISQTMDYCRPTLLEDKYEAHRRPSPVVRYASDKYKFHYIQIPKAASSTHVTTL